RNNRQQTALPEQVAAAPISEYTLHGIKHAFLPEFGLIISQRGMTRGLRFGHPRQPYSRFGKLTAPMKRTYILLMCAAMSLFSASAQTTAPGKRQFEDRCAGCHGADGNGGGHGPAIVDMKRPRTSTREDIMGVIRKGIPEAGMPAFAISD